MYPTWSHAHEHSIHQPHKLIPSHFTSGDDEDDDPESELDLPHVPYTPARYAEDSMLERSRDFYTLLNQRRSVRFISPEPVPREVIDNVIRTAGGFSLGRAMYTHVRTRTVAHTHTHTRWVWASNFTPFCYPLFLKGHCVMC